MTNDLIANMLTNIRNASKILHLFTFCTYSKINLNILNILQLENYINNSLIVNNNKNIKIFLKYTGWWLKKPTFTILKRISKSGQRIFSPAKNLKKSKDIINYSKGLAILSTSSGLLTHHKAYKLKKGGEILCYIE